MREYCTSVQTRSDSSKISVIPDLCNLLNEFQCVIQIEFGVRVTESLPGNFVIWDRWFISWGSFCD